MAGLPSLPQLPQLKPPDLNQLKYVLMRNLGINLDYTAFLKTLTADILKVPSAQFLDFKNKMREAGFKDFGI